MQREIKFRGKRVENGAWVYGQYFNVKRQGFCVGIGHYILPENSVFANKVNPKTVGQYTGLKDKNGNEIYEGDIVTGLFNHTDIIGHIVYGSDATFFIERKGLYGIGLNNAEDWLEVVGNIYENPELLKE